MVSGPPRPIVRDLVIVSLLALLARVIAAAIVGYAPYTDPAYYSLVAQELAAGNGFHVPVIWSFLEVGSRIPDPAVLPVASNGHWMPLTSIVAAWSMDVLGASWRAGQVPMVVLSTLLVPLTYWIGWELWQKRWVALVAGVLAIFPGPLLIYYSTVDNFAVFGVLGALSLYAAVRAVPAARPGVWLLASGMFAGLATLARVDGILLTVAPAIAWLELRGWRSVRLWRWGAASALAFLVVLWPWLSRDIATYGAPFPSAGGHTLWITSYNEQFSIGHPVDLASYLAWGLVNIIGSKLSSGFEILGRTAVLLGGTFFITFVPGLWIHRRRPELVPFIGYWVVMVVVMAVVFTFHAPHGAFYHSAPAWLPFALPMAVASLPAVATWIGRAWPFLRRRQTHRFLLVVGLAGAAILSLAGSATILGQWEDSHAQDAVAGGYFSSHNLVDDVVMSDDPASLWQVSGNPGVPIPFDSYPVIEAAAAAYGARWLVIDLRDGAAGDPLGLWAGGHAVDAEGNRATWLATQPVVDSRGVRIYRIQVPAANPPNG